MKYGIFDHVDCGTAPLAEFYEDRLKLAEKYDAAGFYAYHTAEHHATTLGMASSPSVFLSALAQRTKRLRFGPLVYCLPQYHPVRLYEEICMLDQMSSGRLELGVGHGISPIESSFYGLDPADVPAMYLEYYQFIMQAFEQPEEVTFKGDYFSVEKMPLEMKPLQNPHPPIWKGLGNPKAIEWPAENSVNIISNQSSEIMRGITDAYREEWDKLGRDQKDLPLMGMTRFIVIGETDEKALIMAKRMYALWYKSFMKLWLRYDKTPPLAAYTEDFEGIVKTGQAVTGSPETVYEILQQQIEESGVNYFVSRFAFGDVTYEEAAFSTDAFAEKFLAD